MTPREVIAQADAIKPNAFTEAEKLRWLGELEGRIAADVFLLSTAELRQLAFAYPDAMDKELLVQWPHNDIYELWLLAKIDFGNAEYDKYQNTMQAYNESFVNFTNWFVRTYAPAQGYRGVR